jgi:DNA-directed RNA polymerase I subunit RPA2
MPSRTPLATNTKWSTEFDTVRRHKLFKNPPTDHTAYPLLAATIEPHIKSFNSIFEPNGQLEEAIKDIGTKVFLDGNPLATGKDDVPRNKLSVRIREVVLQKAQIPPQNKHTVLRREILPSECRERHITYRGKMTARLEFKVNNGDWKDLPREIGNFPIMLRVSSST